MPTCARLLCPPADVAGQSFPVGHQGSSFEIGSLHSWTRFNSLCFNVHLEAACVNLLVTSQHLNTCSKMLHKMFLFSEVGLCFKGQMKSCNAVISHIVTIIYTGLEHVVKDLLDPIWRCSAASCNPNTSLSVTRVGATMASLRCTRVFHACKGKSNQIRL